MPGYDLAKVDLNTLASKYKCASCERLLRDAMQTSCGHLYCLSCLDSLIVHVKSVFAHIAVQFNHSSEAQTSTLKCPHDGTIMTQAEVFPDNFVRREIHQLVLHCTFAEQGCMWKGDVKNLETHLKTDCPAYPLICPMCNEARIPRSQNMSRSRSDEPPQEHAASHTSLLVNLALNLFGQVELLMGDRPHVPFINVNLVAAMLDILSTVVQAGENELLLEAHERRLRALERDIRRQPARPTSLAFDIVSLEAGDHCDDLRQQTNSLSRQLESALETIRRLERRVEATEHSLAMKNIAMADLEEYVRQQEVSSYDGVLLWKITDFARRKNDAISGKQQSFYSPCFYTSRHGYKMCARIYLNGDGMGRGTHISVFFTVMRGMYDALLRWPFRQKVTIMLLDQDNVEHVIDAFRPDPNSSSFQRPRREMNVASGCPLFCSLVELNKHAYVRDDVMFMKIFVDTSDL